jgi:hypothetical protein
MEVVTISLAEYRFQPGGDLAVPHSQCRKILLARFPVESKPAFLNLQNDGVSFVKVAGQHRFG